MRAIVLSCYRANEGNSPARWAPPILRGGSLPDARDETYRTDMTNKNQLLVLR